jgi:hypothetical protein
LVKALGFSNGCAELALKKPPPLVPRSLIASIEATGPWAITCVAPSRVLTEVYGLKFWIEPCDTSTSAVTKEIGSSTYRVHLTTST